MSKSLLAGLKQIAQRHPETRRYLVPLIRQAAITRQDLAFFDKPGLYKPVQIQLMGMGGEHTYTGYMRDDEIQAGEQRRKEYVQKDRPHLLETQKQFAAKKGDRYDRYLQYFKTPAEAEAALEDWARKLDRIEHASSLKELFANVAPVYEPAEYKGKLMLLGGIEAFGSAKGSNKAIHRYRVVKQAEKEGPRSVLKLIAAGIQIEDRPGWGAAADATRKAGDFLKRRREQLLTDLRQQATVFAEKTFVEVAAKYPMANPDQLPNAMWLADVFRRDI